MADEIFIEVTKQELNDFIKNAIEECLREYKIIGERVDDLIKID
jgi:hypothetical protein